MGDMAWLGQLGIQFMLWTGTASDAMVSLMFKKFGIVNYTTCHVPTIWLNIALNKTLVEEQEQVKDMVVEWFIAKRGTGIVLIFCWSKLDTEILA